MDQWKLDYTESLEKGVRLSKTQCLPSPIVSAACPRPSRSHLHLTPRNAGHRESAYRLISEATPTPSLRSLTGVVRGRHIHGHRYFANNFTVRVDELDVEYPRLPNLLVAGFEIFQPPSETSADHIIAISLVRLSCRTFQL